MGNAIFNHVVVHAGALGDFVLTWPWLRTLGARVGVVASPSKAKLAARFLPRVKALSAEEPGWSNLFAEGGGDARVASKLRELTGYVISFVSDGHDTWAQNVRRLTPTGQLICIQPRPPTDWPHHVLDWQFAQLRAQELAVEPTHVPLRHNPVGPIVLHVGAGSRAKRWPLHYVAQLLPLLPAAKVLAGEVEREQFTPAEHQLFQQIAGRFLNTLDELADELLTARLVIANDSGPGHLAAQLGIPVLSLFGPTSPPLWQPRGPSVHALRTGPNINDLRVDDVRAGVHRVLDSLEFET